ncbi:hypothetical protein Bca4012_072155 [Brassica carinata]
MEDFSIPLIDIPRLSLSSPLSNMEHLEVLLLSPVDCFDYYLALEGFGLISSRVTQLNTLDRAEANRRRLEDRRPPRQLSLSRDREWRREPSHSLHRSSDKTYVSDYIRRDYRKNYDSQGCYERDRTSLARRTDDYSLSRSENQRNHTARPPPGHPPPPTWRPVTMAGNLKTPTQSIQSQVSHTPSPRPLREVMLPPGNATARNTGDHEPHSRERRSALERISVPGHDTDRTEAQHEKVSSTKSPGSQQHGTEERRSALERLTSPITPGHGVIDSQQMHDPYHETPDVLAPGASDRRPARERLSGQPTRVPLLHNGVANLDSGRLQEVNIQYLEDTLPPVSGGLSLGSSSRAQTFNFGASTFCKNCSHSSQGSQSNWKKESLQPCNENNFEEER